MDVVPGAKIKGKGKEKVKEATSDKPKRKVDAAEVEKPKEKSKVKAKEADKPERKEAKDKKEKDDRKKDKKEKAKGKPQDEKPRAIKPLPSTTPAIDPDQKSPLTVTSSKPAGKKAKLVSKTYVLSTPSLNFF